MYVSGANSKSAPRLQAQRSRIERLRLAHAPQQLHLGYCSAARVLAAPEVVDDATYWSIRHVSRASGPFAVAPCGGATRASGGPNAAQSVSFSCTTHFQSVFARSGCLRRNAELATFLPGRRIQLQRVPPSAKTTSLRVATLAILWTT